MLGGIERIA